MNDVDSANGHVSLRLYVASDSAASVLARRQFETLHRRLGDASWKVEVIDVFQQPRLAEADRVLATPVLIRVLPTPRLSVIGDFSDLNAVVSALDLNGESEP